MKRMYRFSISVLMEQIYKCMANKCVKCIKCILTLLFPGYGISKLVLSYER